jgi:hypothetical protein
VGVEVEEIPEGLDSDDGPGNCLVSWTEAKERHLQGIPCTAAQFGEDFSIIEEVAPENLWDAEGEVAVGDGLEDLLTKPLTEFHHSFLVAGGTEMAPCTREGQQILVAAVLAFDAGKTVVEDAAIKIAIDHRFHISTEEAVLDGDALFINLLKFLKVILNTMVILRILRFARAGWGRNVGHRLSCP